MVDNHHHSSCQHSHGHSHGAHGLTTSRLALSALMTGAFVLFEVIASLRAGSLALLSDAGHNFTDLFALCLSWYAIKLSKKPATDTRTFGFHRASILTALANALTLVVIAIVIVQQAVARLLHPVEVQSSTVMIVASIALFLNLFIALALRGEAKHSVNVRSAFLHMVGDAIASIGVVIAGAIIHFTGWNIADPITSLILAGFIGWSSWSIIRETVTVLLEGTPTGMDVKSLANDILSQDGVLDLHDLHVWTIADDLVALSCHLLLANTDMQSAASVVQSVKRMLSDRYHIEHATIETECGGCDGERYCSLGAPAAIRTQGSGS